MGIQVLVQLREGSRELGGCLAVPLFGSVAQERVKQLVQLARLRDPSFVPGGLHLWHRVVDPLCRCPVALATELASAPGVVSVSLQARGVLPPSLPSLVERGASVLDEAPHGIGVEAVRRFPGGRGEGVPVAVVEQGWVLDAEGQARHPALPRGIRKLDWGRSHPPSAWHGMRTLGVLAALPGSGGRSRIEGIAWGCGPIWLAAEGTDESWAPADALLQAIEALQDSPGAVLLIEAQLPVLRLFCRSSPGWTEVDPSLEQVWGRMCVDAVGAYGPWEASAPLFQLIRLATALGIVVVEAAGNGYVELGSMQLDRIGPGGEPVGERVGSRDSGAILVSAANADRTRGPAWNHGRRIDAFAPGEGIPSIDDPVTGDGLYTEAFSDTSAAAAVIAGAAVVTQGLATHATGRPLGAGALRELLRHQGTPVAGGQRDLVGVMPNLLEIASALGVG